MNYRLIRKDSEEILYYFREKEIEETMQRAPFSCVLLQVEDWERDLSPFPYENFAGGAAKSLMELKQIVREAEEGMSVKKRCIAGYSLAGLFALYAFYETDLFQGAASCSGSLWFPHFADYLKDQPRKEGRIYLSLGKKEEKSRHPLMKQVGDVTRDFDEQLTRQNVEHILEMNEGGHFHEPDRRLLRGMEWIMETKI